MIFLGRGAKGYSSPITQNIEGAPPPSPPQLPKPMLNARDIVEVSLIGVGNPGPADLILLQETPSSVDVESKINTKGMRVTGNSITRFWKMGNLFCC